MLRIGFFREREILMAERLGDTKVVFLRAIIAVVGFKKQLTRYNGVVKRKEDRNEIAADSVIDL